MTSEPMKTSAFRPRLPGRLIETITGLGVPFRIAGINHPIVRLDIKGIRWMKADPRARLHRMIGRRMRWTVIVALLLILLDLFSLLARFQNFSNGRYYYGSDIPSAYILLGAFLFSLLMAVVGDFYYMIRSLKAVTPERESGHWDMIRLTPMPPEKVLDAKYAAVQLQSWRVLTVEYIPRFYLFIAVLPYLYTSSLRYLNVYSRISNIFNWELVLASIAIFLLLLFYVLEAGWRMRALTAIGLAISSRSRNLTTNFIVGFFVLMGVHIAEVITLFAPYYLMNNIYYALYRYERSIPRFIGSYLLPLLMVIMIGLSNYVILRIFRLIALRYARRNAFRDI